MSLPDLETQLAELVALPSCSSSDPALDRSNRAVVDRLATYCESVGGVVDVRPAGPAGKWNLVARFGSGEGGIVLAGHTDTVPHDEHGWSSDPFRLTERGGKLYGLGATDMKGFFPAALHALATVGAAHLRSPVVLVGTADEESTMAGARRLLAEGDLAGASVVIGEPTGLAPVHLHKGVAQDRITLVGAAGHASDPANGVSALDGMVAVLEALLRHRLALRETRDARFPVPFPTLNLGRIEGGDAANRICARCSLDVDRRLHPGTSLDASRATLAALVREAVTDRRLVVSVEPLFDGIEAFETPADAEILALAEAITGTARTAVPFATEAPLFQAMGKPTIVLGPGDIRAAHAIDEHVSRAELHRAVDVYGTLIARSCTDSAS